MEGARGCTAQRGQPWEAVRLCRERPLQPGARCYGSRQRWPTNSEAQLPVRREVRAVRQHARPNAPACRGAPACDEFPMEIIAAWRRLFT